MRSDVHSPKNLQTEDYEFVGCGNHATAELDSYSPIVHLLAPSSASPVAL